MRLSDWRATPQGQASMPPKVAATFESALHSLGVSGDPPAFVMWGDQPDVRYQVLAATDAGMAVVGVRVNVPQEGPRASGRLVRWSRVQAGELTVEAHHGRHQVTAQLEGQVLIGLDEEGDRIAEWMAEVYRRIDGGAERSQSS